MADLPREIVLFTEAARWAGGLVGALPASAWNDPGLGEWDMRALVGHTSRAMLTVEQYLGRPAKTEDVESPEAYYELAASATGSVAGAAPAAVLQRGIDAGAALGEDPAAEFDRIVGRVTETLLGAEDRLIDTIAGGMLLSRYLPTRTFELVVHGLDIALAAGLAADPPEAPLRGSLALATSLATRSGRGADLLLALAGRRPLDPDVSVVP